MSEQKWKPGQVAMVTLKKKDAASGLRAHIAMRDNCGGWASGTTFDRRIEDEQIADAYPLVVIDPDKTKGKGLLPDWLRHHASEIARESAGGRASIADDMRYIADQIEAQTAPLKPEEPLGLGAVVADAEGELFIRDKTTTTVAHWKRARGEDGGARYHYADISAVRVLSQGVTP